MVSANLLGIGMAIRKVGGRHMNVRIYELPFVLGRVKSPMRFTGCFVKLFVDSLM